MKKLITSPGHIHTWRCTESSCPGNGFPTREDLIRRALARIGRRRMSTDPSAETVARVLASIDEVGRHPVEKPN